MNIRKIKYLFDSVSKRKLSKTLHKMIPDCNMSVLQRGVMRICLLMGVLLLPAIMLAETVSQKQAKEYAQNFFNQAYRENSAPVKYVYNGKRLTTNRLLTPFYVYNHPRGGFVIISAENKTFPILAYSLKTTFDPDKLTEGERGWLKNYAMDIEMISHDGRVPEQTISAWQDYPHFVTSMLDAKYVSTDPTITIEEATTTLNDIVTTPDDSSDGNFSAVYTSNQWQDMIDAELETAKSVAIGYVDFDKKVFPGVIYGKKGDYYKIAFENRGEWMVRLMAAEYLGERFVAGLTKPAYRPEPESEEQPFAFYEEIVEAQRAEAAAREERIAIAEKEPLVRSMGGGHFDVLLPENAVLAMLYNINGAHIGRVTYKDTPMAHIDIEKEPYGFYFALIIGESGKPYGIKLYR